jgi:hypothetical protein
VRAFAAELRAGGHSVHTPDLYEGERFGTIDDGFAYLQSDGDEAFGERTERALAGLPEGLVYAGFSWGRGSGADPRRGQGSVLRA